MIKTINSLESSQEWDLLDIWKDYDYPDDKYWFSDITRQYRMRSLIWTEIWNL